jgi:hypothetical protein
MSFDDVVDEVDSLSHSRADEHKGEEGIEVAEGGLRMSQFDILAAQAAQLEAQYAADSVENLMAARTDATTDKRKLKFHMKLQEKAGESGREQLAESARKMGEIDERLTRLALHISNKRKESESEGVNI